MLDDVTNLHFLYPQWLWGLIPCAALWWLLNRRQSNHSDWRTIISPTLFRHLRQVRGSQSSVNPRRVLVVFMVLVILAMAGPSLHRDVPEALDNQSATIILLDNSLSMYSSDIAPTRSERAKQKISDLLALRHGTRMALITYSGSAHTVTPFTKDPYFFELYLNAIEPALMPSEGMNLATALQQAQALLSHVKEPANILLVTDSVRESDRDLIHAFTDQFQVPVLILSVGTAQGGELKLPEGFNPESSVDTTLPVAEFVALRDSGIPVIGVTANDDDILWLDHRMQSSARHINNTSEDFSWQNNGIWLVWCLIPIALMWFRKGWTLYSLMLVTSLSMSVAPTPARANFIDWWLTPDQQGQLAFNKGNYTKAAQHFQNLYWKGLSSYRAGQYDQASALFEQLARQPVQTGDVVDSIRQTANAWFYQGNSLARLKEWDKALASYDRALRLQPVFSEATENYNAVAHILEQLEKERQSRNESQQAEAQFTPDDVRLNENQDEGVQVETNLGDTTVQPESWLESLQVSPAQFMANRFYQEFMSETSQDGVDMPDSQSAEPMKKASP